MAFVRVLTEANCNEAGWWQIVFLAFKRSCWGAVWQVSDCDLPLTCRVPERCAGARYPKGR